MEVRMTHIKELIDKNMEFLIKNSRPEDNEKLTKEWEKIKADIEIRKITNVRIKENAKAMLNLISRCD